MFGKHKVIERFSVIFLSLTLCMSILLVSIVVRKNVADKNRLSNQSIYTTQVAMSRSGVMGNVVDVMVSKDKTKAFVLWKMEDMMRLPVNAKDYCMFLTGSDASQYAEDLLSQPSGGLFVLGASGYMGAYLVNNEPFPSQILNLVVRAKKDYSSDVNYGVIPEHGDATFGKFDQLQIYFNPGAAGARHVECLDEETLDMKELYKEAVVRVRKQEIRNVLNRDIQQMLDARRLMDKYMETLTSGVLGIELAEPTVPDFIEADTIKAYAIDSGNELTWSDEQNSFVDEVEKLKYSSDMYYLDFETDYVVDGGFNFDWRNEPKQGYLEELRGTSTIDEYLSEQKKLYDSAKDSEEFQFVANNLKWYYGDGSEFRVDINAEDKRVQDVSKVIDQLTTQWQTYYNLRMQYQTQDLRDLLYLERDAAITLTTYSENFDENVLTKY